MLDAAARLFPGQATTTLALLQTGPNVVPIVVIPLVGSALDSRHAPWAFLALAAFVAAAGFANLRQPQPITLGRQGHATGSDDRAE